MPGAWNEHDYCNSRLQSYMILATEKDSEIYKAMKVRYTELKVILTTSGVNLTELDRKVTIETSQPLWVHTDGEVTRRSDWICVGCERNALRVVG